MQLITVGIARSAWLFDINELNPSGKSFFPDILLWLAEKYSFHTFPKSLADIDKETKALAFKTGTFQADDEAIVVNFSLYNDGIVAESWASTERTDEFIEDVLHFASVKYGLAYKPKMIRKKQYVSEITFKLDAPIANLNPKLLKFCETLTNTFKRHNLPPFQIYGLGFSPDTSDSTYKPPGFTIERKIKVPYEENRFWSKSPFPTHDHLNMLIEFEKVLRD